MSEREGTACRVVIMMHASVFHMFLAEQEELRSSGRLTQLLEAFLNLYLESPEDH